MDTNTQRQVLAMEAIIIQSQDVEHTNFKGVIDGVPIVAYAHTKVETAGLNSPMGSPLLFEGVRYLKI